MMECKKALVEAEGDFDQAMKILREKGLAVAAKKSDRIAAEGVVDILKSDDGLTTAIVEVNSETDFVAKTDEFQQLLGNKDCTDFYFQLSSRARKWGAILTSITQHVRSVLDNEDARRMLSDCGYIKLLNQSPDDANDLARLLHISNEEKRYIENAEVGSGLLIVSKTVVPFNNDFPKDTELFRLMDTSPNRKS